MSIRIKALLLLLATFVVYVVTRSLWLDEWDSVQFAMGVGEFNLWKHQPHPPGYPVYIFAGWLLTQVGLDPVAALVVVSCLTGAVLVAAWFLIARLEFDEPFAWLLALTLAATPAIWMTATKALTDIPAAAALSVAVYFGLLYRRGGHRRALVACALSCALATGLRPQFFAVALVLLLTVLVSSRADLRTWGSALGALLLGNVLWLAPTCVVQARLDPNHVDPLAYPHQLVKQWQWRLDKPNVYIGAGHLDAASLAKRYRTHLGGWFRNGLGLDHSAKRDVFRLLLWSGLILTLLRNRHSAFWRLQAPWAILLALIVFCCLPEDRRYYVALAPLMWLAILPGLWSLPRSWRYVSLLAPLLMLNVGVPLAWAGHREPPPPVQMIDYVKAAHPPSQRGQVWLLLDDTRRHGDWYAQDFNVVLARSRSMSAAQVREALAIYTDTGTFATNQAFIGCTLQPVATFKRDTAIYPKHSQAQLFRVVRSAEVPTIGK